MDNNKDRDMNQAPVEEALENGLEVQTAQPDEAPLEEVDSGRVDEMTENPEAEAAPEIAEEAEQGFPGNTRARR